MKLCSRCGISKALSNFSFNDGRPRSSCKPCRVVEQREWRQANPEKARELAAKWVRDNPEKRKAIWTKSRQENLEGARAREAAYRERKRAECNARISVWKKRNPEKVLSDKLSRRAAEAMPAWARSDAMLEIYRLAKRLREETGEKYEVDHIVPLRGRGVCGLHWEGNLQVVPAIENRRKCNYRWPDMP